MAGARRYLDSDIKRLFTLSGNQCSKPGCENKVLSENYERVIGQICHITAASEEGPRYFPNLTDDKRRRFKNLILLCHEHHREIDDPNFVHKFPAKLLLRWKSDHIDRFLNEKITVPDKTVEDEVEKLQKSIENIEKTAKKINKTSSEVLQKVNEIDNRLSNLANEYQANNKYLVSRSNVYAKEINTKEFVETYFKNLLKDVGIFQGIGINNLYDEDEFLYVEPTIEYNEDFISYYELISSVEHIWLSGSPGAGKSFLLQKSVVDCLKNRYDYIPLYISLNEYDYLDEPLFELITQKFYAKNFDAGLVFEQIADERKILLLLDGYDEILERKKKVKLRTEWLRIIKEYPTIKTIITSRPVQDDFVNLLSHCKITDLSSDSITSFIEAWSVKNAINIDAKEIIHNLKKSKLYAPSYDHENDISCFASMMLDALSTGKHAMYNPSFYRIDSFRKNIFTSPLLLSLICELYIHKASFFGSYTDIFDAITKFIFSKWNTERIEKKLTVKDNNISKFELIQFSNYLAYKLLGEFRINIEEKELYHLTKSYFKDKDIDVSDYEAIYTSLHLDYGILKKSSYGLYSFFHLSFAEYFCAKYMRDLTFDELLPIRSYFLYRQKEIGKYYFEMLNIQQQKKYLQRGFQAAFYHMMSDTYVNDLISKVKHLVNTHINNTLSPAEIRKEKILLFYFFLYTENLTEYALAITTISGVLLQRLILNILGSDLMDNPNYLFLSRFQSIEYYAEYIGNKNVIDVAAIIKEEYSEEGSTQIAFKNRNTKLGFAGATKLASALYVTERLLWLNSQNNNIQVSDIINIDNIESIQYLPEEYIIDVFSVDTLHYYATEVDFCEESIETITEIYNTAVPKIKDQFFYYFLIATDSVYRLKNYKLAKHVLDIGINDYHRRNEYWDEHYKIENLSKEKFILDLYEIRGYVNFQLAIKDWVNEAYDIEIMRKAIGDYAKKPLNDIKPEHTSYYACALMLCGEEDNNTLYLEKSLQLYIAAIDHEEDYIIGYLNAIKIALTLEKKDKAQKLFNRLESVVDEIHIKEKKGLKKVMAEYRVFLKG